MKKFRIPAAYQILSNKGGIILDKIPDNLLIASIITYALTKHKNVKAIAEIKIPIYFHRIIEQYYVGFNVISQHAPLVNAVYLNENIDRFIELLKQSENISGDTLQSIISTLQKVEVYTISEKINGLLPSLWINELKNLLMNIETGKENYAFSFQIEDENARDVILENAHKVQNIIKSNKEIEEKILELMKVLDERFKEILRRIDKEIEIWEGRYDAEIIETREEVERRIRELQLKMQEEIDRIVKWRDYNLWYYKTYFNDTTSEYVRNIRIQAERSLKSVHERYTQLIENEKRKIIAVEQKKNDALAPILRRKASILNDYKKIQQKLSSLLKNIRDINIRQQEFFITLPEDENIVIIEIPHYVIVYDDNKFEILPLLRFDTQAKLKLFTNFVFPFKPLDEFWEMLSKSIEHTIKVQVKLFANFIKKCFTHNMLNSEIALNLFKEGFDILVAKRLAKKDLFKEIISKFNIRKEKEKTKEYKSEVKTETGELIIEIKDNEKNPIPDAVIVIEGKRYTVDELGRIFIKYPAGVYRINVVAEGYKEKDLEVRIYPNASTEYEIILDKLSDSEMLLKELPTLVKFVKKYGIKSLSVEKKVEELAQKYKVSEGRIWQEIYNYFIKEWINSGKKKEALEAALLYIAKEAKKKGGIMPFIDVVIEVQSFGILVTSKEVEKALQKLAENDIIAGIQEISGIKMVFFTPVGTTGDIRKIIELAAENNGELTREEVILKMGWTPELAEMLLNKLEESGIATSGVVGGKKVWWFPALYKRK
ncbi:MAG: hypothetical protein ACP6IS_04045 [Candidatus Asgardarchaeia archaeon]